MKTNSNLYIFLYASAMVVLVAAVLALASTTLKPSQRKNIETEKKLDILKSFGKAAGADQAKSKHQFVNDQFARYIVDQYAVDYRGNRIPGLAAFDIDLKAELGKPLEQRNLPVYEAKLDDGSLKYIIPVRGRGLWGPIWGYISLNDDLSTVFGATFAHQGETPGLGAEIATPEFQAQFQGKTIFSDTKFVSISVVKGGAPKGDTHGVDAISGGTITSQGVERMLFDCLSSYKPFFDSKKQK
jgi:Na+-transporting NADH:ubiquinone oxidoreductase subunit C